VKRTVTTTIQHRFRIELTHADVVDLLRRASDLHLPTSNNAMTLSVDEHTLDEWPLVLEWTETETRTDDE
jgi:hypothetical protein